VDAAVKDWWLAMEPVIIVVLGVVVVGIFISMYRRCSFDWPVGESRTCNCMGPGGSCACPMRETYRASMAALFRMAARSHQYTDYLDPIFHAQAELLCLDGFTTDSSEWLGWLSRVRFSSSLHPRIFLFSYQIIRIVHLSATVFPEPHRDRGPPRFLFGILAKWVPDARWQARSRWAAIS